MEAKEKVEIAWKAGQERRTKQGEDFQSDQRARALVEQVRVLGF